ncbi:Trypanosomal VSG domain containing protein, putative [Trypanosoma equiperdum]|uniref:Trypanosomal VSG domain containing protein, putative n=1 Tax=Trypanosoma equiperdum TaxID=5694 RepID=A0A1G4I4U6_TRYEQ|nr:Trypanosomal VSG domain containing protein, putative [Trypanosoma equiperdum]
MNALQWVIVLTVAILKSTDIGETATTGESTNAAAFSTLCGFYNALTAPPEAAEVTTELKALVADVGALNMSASPENFRNLFDPEGSQTKKNHPNRPKDPPDAVASWGKYYDLWLASRQQLAKNQKERELKNAANILERTKNTLKL